MYSNFPQHIQRYSSIYAFNVGIHKKTHGKRKPIKSRLYNIIKKEENRIELQTALNWKLRKSKPRKSRNSCIVFWRVSFLSSTFFSWVSARKNAGPLQTRNMKFSMCKWIRGGQQLEIDSLLDRRLVGSTDQSDSSAF